MEDFNEDEFAMDLEVIASGKLEDAPITQIKEIKSTPEGDPNKDKEDTEFVETEETIDESILASGTLEVDPNDDNKNIDPNKSKEKTGEPPVESGGSDKTSKSPSSELISPLALSLHEAGVFSNLSQEELGKIQTAQDFVEAVKKHITENEYADLNESQKNCLDLFRAGIPVETVKQVVSVDAQLSSITEEDLNKNPELRKTVLLQELVSKNIPKERAEKMVEKTIAAGDDLAESKESLKALQEISKNNIKAAKEAKEREAKEALEKNKKYVADLKTKVLNTEEFIKGIKAPSVIREKVFDSMTKPVKYDEQGKPLNAIQIKRAENPEAFEMRLHYLFQITNGFEDFSVLNQKSTTTALKTLEDKLNANTATNGKAKKEDLSSDGQALINAVKNFRLA